MTDNIQSSIIVRKCNYFCKKCDYTCEDFVNWEKHTKNNKHITKSNKHNTTYENDNIEQKLCKYSCCKQSVINNQVSSWKKAWQENGVCYKCITKKTDN